MNFIPTWLSPFGYQTDPYSYPQAENLPEELINDLFVRGVVAPRSPESNLNILNYPASTIIHGWGKTMGLSWLIWWSKDKRKFQGTDVCPLVIPYTHFQTMITQPAPYTQQHHAAPLMTVFAMALLMALSEVPYIFLSQDIQYQQNYWAFLRQYIPEDIYRNHDWTGLPDEIVEAGQSSQEDRLALDGELDQSLGLLASWLQRIGFQRIYICIDNLSGYPQTKDPRVAAQLIAPLIETDQLFHIPGLYWKIFLSDEIKDQLLPALENRPARYRVFPITWKPCHLIEMVKNTLTICADPPLEDLNQLTERRVSQWERPIIEELASLANRYPGGPPKNMLMFINELLQRTEQTGSYLITEEVASSYIDEIKQVIARAGAKEQDEAFSIEASA